MTPSAPKSTEETDTPGSDTTVDTVDLTKPSAGSNATASTSNAADADPADTNRTVGDRAESASAAERRRRIRDERAAAHQPKTITLSVSRTTAALGALCVVLAIVAIVFGALWLTGRSDLNDARGRLAAIDTTNDQNKRAEDVATRYAVGAATIDYQNLSVWEKALVANTTPELSTTLQQAAAQMEQIYSPVQWRSTATPIAAVATSNQNGVIAVNVFVSVITKTTQTPSGMPSTATYAVTVDTRRDWVISDVRGIDSALPK
ncbi:hypothetical protein GCM10023147_35710 [Tsukamurella soli]|uniref:Mce-associated membrane protein n=1 Tax=Tsukamurella soli TaxID=644556 RepID=A0ABP8K0U1_9ACTN